MRPAAIGLVALALAGCGGDGEPDLTVSAASSLKEAFTEYGDGFEGADVRLSFAGSDQLAAQIRAGARPDVFASANEDLPRRLFDDGLVERPVKLASNRLVVAVPDDAGRVSAFDDLAEPGIRIAAGSPSVPIGAYTREALAGLPGRRAIEANVRTREPDVSGIVGKISQGAVDAGFVYATDARAAGLRAIEMPVRVPIAYAAAVVRGTDHAEQARRFVAGLEGSHALRAAGFERP